MSLEFDTRELDEFVKDTIDLAYHRFPRETKNFMGRVGNKFKSKAKAAYSDSSIVGRKTGNLIAGVNRGRPYIYGSDEFSVRAYNHAPHAWLIEHGHAQHVNGTKVEKYVKGRAVMASVVKSFDAEYPALAEKFVDKMLSEGKL